MALRYFAGRAAGAAVGAAAGSSTVQARAPVAAPQVVEQRSAGSGKCLDDEWLVLQPQHGDIVLMKPFEAFDVDDAIADVAQHMQAHNRGCRPVVLHAEVQDVSHPDAHSGTSTPTSQGSAADSQITGTFLTGSFTQASGTWPAAEEQERAAAAPGIDISTLLGLTSRMLKRPGMQVELVKAMMEDREIQEILLRENPDLDNYLLAAGALPIRSLLPPSAVAAVEGEAAQQTDASAEEMNGLEQLVNNVMVALEHAGARMGRLLGWLRGRVASLLGHDTAREADAAAAEAEAAAAASSDGGAGARPGGRHDRDRARMLLQGVLAVAAVVLVVMIFKRPGSFRRAPSFFRR